MATKLRAHPAPHHSNDIVLDQRGSEPTWQSIVPAAQLNVATGLVMYAPGWHLNAYNTDHSHYFKIPSESILVTKGSQRYIELYNAHGPYLKYRFQLCWEHLTGGCRFNERCGFIHCASTVDVSVTDVHYNSATATHPRHDAGKVMNVYLPNSTTEHEQVPSENIVITQRSTYMLDRGITSNRRSQHCAHFYLNKVCTRGSQCNFMHVIPKASAATTTATSPSPISP